MTLSARGYKYLLPYRQHLCSSIWTAAGAGFAINIVALDINLLGAFCVMHNICSGDVSCHFRGYNIVTWFVLPGFSQPDFLLAL